MVVGEGFNSQSVYKLPLAQPTPTWAYVTDDNIALGYRSAAAWDPVGQRIIIVGGLGFLTSICPSSTLAPNNMVRSLSLAGPTPVWTSLGSGPFQAVTDASLMYDSIRSRMLLFGGVTPSDPCRCGGGCCPYVHDDDEFPYNAVWSYKLSAGTWTALSPTGTLPTARGHHAAAYFPPTDEMIVYGGGSHILDITCLPSSQVYSYTYFGDTWQFDPDVVAPVTISDLSAGTLCHEIDVSWTAPQDDSPTEAAAYYEVRYSPTTITPQNFWQATILASGPSAAPGTVMTAALADLPKCTRRYFAVQTRDEAYNFSAISNIASGQTPCVNFCYDAAPPRIVPIAALSMSAPAPNPAGTVATVRIAIPGPMDGEPLDLSIYDPAGRLVRTLLHENARLGERRLEWDLVTSSGAAVARGVYFLRLSVGSKVVSQRLLVGR
jgi:hypothetical protein